jgi:hypothetical protein
MKRKTHAIAIFFISICIFVFLIIVVLIFFCFMHKSREVASNRLGVGVLRLTIDRECLLGEPNLVVGLHSHKGLYGRQLGRIWSDNHQFEFLKLADKNLLILTDKTVVGSVLFVIDIESEVCWPRLGNSNENDAGRDLLMRIQSCEDTKDYFLFDLGSKRNW